MNTLTTRNPTSGRRTMNGIKNVNPTELNVPRNTSSALQRPEVEDVGPMSMWKLCSGYRLSLGHSEEEVWSFCFSIQTPCRAELGQLWALKRGIQDPAAFNHTSQIFVSSSRTQACLESFLWPLGSSQLTKISKNLFILNPSLLKKRARDLVGSVKRLCGEGSSEKTDPK